MESRIVRLFKVRLNITNSWNHISIITKNKVASSVLHGIITWHIFTPRQKNILHEHSQNKYSFIYAILFLLFYFHTICRFCLPKNTNADNICKAIQCFKQHSLVSVVNKNFDWSMILWKFLLSKISPLLREFSHRMKRLITARLWLWKRYFWAVPLKWTKVSHSNTHI